MNNDKQKFITENEFLKYKNEINQKISDYKEQILHYQERYEDKVFNNLNSAKSDISLSFNLTIGFFAAGFIGLILYLITEFSKKIREYKKIRDEIDKETKKLSEKVFKKLKESQKDINDLNNKINKHIEKIKDIDSKFIEKLIAKVREEILGESKKNLEK